ncbi:hypothetical protein [Pseudonocardia nigra]|uniref:hypothetical protein n=1 Tax=Pseudonocardia nigra TaxID=1921578 RepID=UPI001C60647F|nr:hypothetical protein [Pseudonocardia nigra]
MSDERADDGTPVPDTAMATGNDDGEPGEPLGPDALDPEERNVLDGLRRGGGEQVVSEAEEDSPAMRAAVEDDSVLRPDER